MYEDFIKFNGSMPDSLTTDPCLRSASGQRRRERLLLLVWVNDAVKLGLSDVANSGSWVA